MERSSILHIVKKSGVTKHGFIEYLKANIALKTGVLRAEKKSSPVTLFLYFKEGIAKDQRSELRQEYKIY